MVPVTRFVDVEVTQMVVVGSSLLLVIDSIVLERLAPILIAFNGIRT